MKQLTFLTKFLFLALALSFFASCGDDETGGGGDFKLPPVVDALNSGTDLVSSATTVDAGALFKVNVTAAKGDNDMTTFTILEDGVELDASRINYNGAGAGVVANPYTLASSEAAAFDVTIEIMAHTEGGTRTYTFRMADSASETDETSVDITVVTTPLMLAFESANGGFSADATFTMPTAFKVELIATKGGSDLSTLVVTEDGTAIDASRITFNTDNDAGTASAFATNPLDLIDTEKSGFNWFLWVDTHSTGTKTYTFKITDEAGEVEEVSLAITIFAGTAVTELSGKLLKNAAGPVGTGGIDLMTGEGTGSSDAAAHLKDTGSDFSLPNATNWKQKIAPVNGSILRTPAADFAGYGATLYSEEVAAAFDAGSDIVQTDVVNIGDMFLVRAMDGTTFLVKVDNINVTTDNNDDYYDLSIKR